MAQGDMNIANQGFPAFRADLNNQLEALVTNSSGATAPATTFPHQWWLDTSTTPSTLRQRNASNDAWIVVGLFNQTANTFNVPVAQGGTGASTLTANNVLLGNGTNAVQAVAPNTSGNVLTSNGTTWTSAALPAIPVASTAEAQAGTNNTNLITPLRMREGFNAGGSAPVYACRAWVNFNGTGTVAIRASGNVSSVTRNGTGNYTVNFTTAMQDTEYAAIFGGRAVSGGRGGVIFGLDGDTSVKTVSALRVRSSALSSANSDATPQDADNFSVAIFE